MANGDNTPQWGDYAKPGPYTTKLSPQEEQQFQQWVKTNKVPWQDSKTSDYDMRGYWKAQQSGNKDVRTEVNPVDHKPHYPDTWKTPYHKTFSNESQYALPTAGHWNGQTFVPPQRKEKPFNVGGARKAGYSDDEIAEYLAKSRKFDYEGATNAGYSPIEIIDHLAYPSEKEVIAKAPGIKPPPNPMQDSYTKQIATGQMPLESMQPGLPSPFQHKVNADTAMALMTPVAPMEALNEVGFARAATSLAGSVAGGETFSRSAKWMGAGPTGTAIAGALGTLLGGGIGAGVSSISREEWSQLLTSPGSLKGNLFKLFMKRIPGIKASVAQAEAEKEAATLKAEVDAREAAEAAHYKSLTRTGRRLYKESAATEKAAGEAATTGHVHGPAEEPKAVNVKEPTSLQDPRIATKHPLLPEPPPKPPAPPPPEPSRIVHPDSPPPDLAVTYQSYPRKTLFEMAKNGNVDAGEELIRSPKGFPLPENFKYMIEAKRKYTPHREYPPGEIIKP